MPVNLGRPSFAAAARAAVAAFGMALAGVATAAEPGCPDLSGEYENRSGDASGGQVYLSDILSIAPGVMRVIFLSRPDGMILRAPRSNSGMYEQFLPWGDFPCYGTERVLANTRANEALAAHEGRPLGGSNTRTIVFAKSPEGALLVRYSMSGDWYSPALWGYAVSEIRGQGWARFEPYKR